MIGRSPVVDALAKMAVALGWRSAVVDDGGAAADHPGVTTVIDRLDLRAAGVTPASCVVVATQGHYDETALEAAVTSGAAYVGLVASDRRAESVLGYLRDRGADAEALARVHAPAGLDLGHLPTQDIAVAIMAELVQLRASGALPVAAAAEPVVHEEIDPVCQMTVEVANARFHTIHEGRTYYFCSTGCLASFQEDPARYLTTAS